MNSGGTTQAGPLKSPQLTVPRSQASQHFPTPLASEGGETGSGALSAAEADAEAGMEEILPLEARKVLLDYKPGDVVVVATGRGWHLLKVGVFMCRACCSC